MWRRDGVWLIRASLRTAPAPLTRFLLIFCLSGAVLGASYCECFSSSRYCEGCKCTNCENTAEHEDARQKAIARILERSPNAFKPKVNHKGFGSHTKGCNCKKVLRRRGLGPTAPARCRHCHSHRASAECVTLRADVVPKTAEVCAPHHPGP